MSSVVVTLLAGHWDVETLNFVNHIREIHIKNLGLGGVKGVPGLRKEVEGGEGQSGLSLPPHTHFD